MGERKIWKSSIINAILEGEEIEIQDKFDITTRNKDVKVLFQEATDDIPAFYVVVAASFPVVEVITVCYFEDEVWEWTGKIMRRKIIMNCILCNQKMEKVTTSFKSKWGKYELTIDGVTGYRCNQCNKISFDSNEVDMIQNITAGFSEAETKPDNLNVEEVADLLRVSNQTVYNMIKDGKLPAYKVGREWRFNRQEIINALGNAKVNIAARGGRISQKDRNFIESLI